MPKICGRCKQAKETTGFTKNRSCGDGLCEWCKSCKQRYSTAFNRQPKQQQKTRGRNLQRLYGISLADYKALHKKQNGRCAVCGNLETTKRGGKTLLPLSVDHDHLTEKIRGLLCNRCNRMLGMGDENPKLFRKLAGYLEYNG